MKLTKTAKMAMGIPLPSNRLLRFNGTAYDPAVDTDRLSKQLGRVYAAMSSGRWMTFDEIEANTGDPQASISAQIRNLRKDRFGGYLIEKRPRGNREHGLYEYRLAGKQVDESGQTSLF